MLPFSNATSYHFTRNNKLINCNWFIYISSNQHAKSSPTICLHSNCKKGMKLATQVQYHIKIQMKLHGYIMMFHIIYYINYLPKKLLNSPWWRIILALTKFAITNTPLIKYTENQIIVNKHQGNKNLLTF